MTRKKFTDEFRKEAVQKELKRLRKENKVLREERDWLPLKALLSNER